MNRTAREVRENDHNIQTVQPEGGVSMAINNYKG